MSGAARVSKNGEQDEDLMTFAEIGRRLGLTPQGAQHIYKTACRKVRESGLPLQQLLKELDE